MTVRNEVASAGARANVASTSPLTVLTLAAAARPRQPNAAVDVRDREVAADALGRHVAVVDGREIERRAARHAHLDVVLDAVASSQPQLRQSQSSSSRLTVRAEAAHAKRDAAGLALGPKRELRARALDVGLQVAAHGLGRVHLDAVADRAP